MRFFLSVDGQSISYERQKTKLFLSRHVLRLSFEVLKLSRPPMLGVALRGLLSHSGCPGPGTGSRNTRTSSVLHCLMDKQGVGMDLWTSPQNARLDHNPTPPTRTCPQGSRLRPDALRLPNSLFKNCRDTGDLCRLRHVAKRYGLRTFLPGQTAVSPSRVGRAGRGAGCFYTK